MKLSLKPSFNWLFAFVPITVALEHVGGLPAPLVFFAAALAIVPIASLLVHATEQIATRTDLNSTSFLSKINELRAKQGVGNEKPLQ